jgi:Zn finger protein HypA/HybF involved in hydrogenase expression
MGSLDYGELYHVPILVECTGCKKEWYTQDVPVYCPACEEPVGCAIFNCRECGQWLAYATPGRKCEYCGSTDLVHDKDPRFQFGSMSTQKPQEHQQP